MAAQPEKKKKRGQSTSGKGGQSSASCQPCPSQLTHRRAVIIDLLPVCWILIKGCRQGYFTYIHPSAASLFSPSTRTFFLSTHTPLYISAGDRCTTRFFNKPLSILPRTTGLTVCLLWATPCEGSDLLPVHLSLIR